MNATYGTGCTNSSTERSTDGACDRTAPNQPCALISASSARIRAGRSGWPGTSWAITSSSRSHSTRRELSSIAHTVIACRRVRSDLVVVGAGAAGLFAALTAARQGARVALVSARPLAETASYWAQGGAAAALALDDSPALHLQDTLTAGRGLTRRAAAEVLANEAADRVRGAPGARRPVRRRPPRRPGARARGRPQPPPDHPRRRQCHRTPDPARAVGRGRGGRQHRGPRRPPRRGHPHRRRRRHQRRPTDSPHARRSSPPAAPPRCGRARPTRPARSAPACCSPAPPAPSSPTSSSRSSTRPRSSASRAARAS